MSKSKENNAKREPLLDGPNGNFHQLLKKLRKDAGFKSAIAISQQINVHKNTQGIYEKSGDPKVDYLVSFSYLTKTTFWQLMAKRVLMGNAPDPHKQYVLNEIGPLFSPFGDKPDNAVDEKADNDADNGEIIAACQTLLNQNLNKPSIRVYRQSGNSMSPTINEGDTLFINTVLTNLSDGDLFLLSLGHEHMVKRVQLLPSGGVILISDNTQYQPINLSNEDINTLNIQGKLISTVSHYG